MYDRSLKCPNGKPWKSRLTLKSCLTSVSTRIWLNGSSAQKLADGLRNRLDDMRAADSVLQLPAGRPRRDLCNGVDCYRVEFYKDLWLTIVPNHLEPRMNAEGATDWARVRRIRIVGVGELE